MKSDLVERLRANGRTYVAEAAELQRNQRRRDDRHFGANEARNMADLLLAAAEEIERLHNMGRT